MDSLGDMNGPSVGGSKPKSPGGGFGFDPIGAVFNAGASIFNNERNIAASAEANRQNIALARENRDWSQWMANTSRQRDMMDLKAAGLNPVLAAGGSGASTPSSAAAQVEAPKSADMGAAVSDAFTKSIHRQLMTEQVKTAKATAISSGAEAAVAADRARKTVEGQGARNAFIQTQNDIAKSLAPGRKESFSF